MENLLPYLKKRNQSGATCQNSEARNVTEIGIQLSENETQARDEV